MIKVFFAVLVLCTAAIAAVCLAIHFRVRRHLCQEQMEAQVRAVIEDAAETAAEKQKAP